ncbi:TetR/AcrR family transcriptional regulator [Alkalihalobacillus pseudalcaliphilus]|uniref:TetR/AcrR family transcriptional regulator n=1 Tax=Alkalihalobacillus pseudalcaliphilus TaxID=79884 RepID=UPI00064DA62A|nr:TetR family transcriptional regulator [Alkalihalobacillus pseudalcaliphilus]KMK74615.1 TetR family transcriptional regulator [Alkalihalobacillus pseudalcaliphilus]
MPPKNKFSRDQIVEAAFAIAETEGIDRVTIRKVAEQLGSSIAPIYVNFTDVEALKQAVIQKIVEISQRLLAEETSRSPFANIGVASLHFAKTYPILFKDFVMNQNDYLHDYDEGMGDLLIEQMKTDPDLQGFSNEELQDILFKMRTFQIGFSIMVANELTEASFDMEKMIRIMDSTAEDVVSAARLRKGERGI